MYRYGHYGAALLVYAPTAFVTAALGFQRLALIGGVAVVLLAMVPDYDQRIPNVPHRGPTHTGWFAVAVGIAGLLIGAIVGAQQGIFAIIGLSAFGFVVAAGTICSHIAADALTPAGVRPFTPWNTHRYTYDLVKAANPIANYLLLGLGAAVALLALGAGIALSNAVVQ